MIHNMTGGVPGLRLKVAGGSSAPANPAENTLWVNTAAAVSGWVFSAAEPESPTEGLLWIQTGTSASVPINIHRKNTLMVYPTACRQYVSGAWVSREAKTYQDGGWKDWSLYLYNSGQTGLEISFDTEQSSVGTLTASYIHMESTNKYSGTVTMKTSPAVDLTPYTVAKIQIENTGSYATMTVGFGTVQDDCSAASWQYKGEMTKQTVTIDISSLTGSYYLGAKRTTNSDSRAVGVTKIHSVVLE